MATNPEMMHQTEAELPAEFYHEELHAENPEGRDSGVDQWYHRKDRLADYDPVELGVIDQELAALPEVKAYEDEQVRIEMLEEMIPKARDLAPDSQATKFDKLEQDISTLTEQLRLQIDRYAGTLRQFHNSQLARFHLDTERYQAMMKSADSQRRAAHDSLVADFHALSRFLTQRVPKVGGVEFNATGWEEHLKQHWFSYDQLKDRDYLADWSVKTDIVEKARALRQAITETIEKKSAETV